MIIWCATIILAMSTLSDGKITVWEAWLYPALYVIYIILCTYWKEIEAKIHRDLRRVRRICHSRRDPGHRPGAGVALDTRVRGTLPTSHTSPPPRRLSHLTSSIRVRGRPPLVVHARACPLFG